MLTIRILLLGIVATSIGCTPPFEKLRKKHGPSLEAKLAQVAAIGKAVEALPALTTDDEKIPLPRVSKESSGRVGGTSPHVAFMYREAFADLTDYGPSFARMSGSNPFNVCASLLRNQRCPQGCEASECTCYDSDSTLRGHFDDCDRIQVLLVIRTLEFGEPGAPTFVETRLAAVPDARVVDARLVAKPDVGVADTRANRRDGGVAPDSRTPDARVVEHWTFRGGMMRGEVHAYALDGARRLGGFGFHVINPLVLAGSREVAELRSATSAAQLVQVKRWFAEVIQQTIRDESKRRIPTAFTN